MTLIDVSATFWMRQAGEITFELCSYRSNGGMVTVATWNASDEDFRGVARRPQFPIGPERRYEIGPNERRHRSIDRRAVPSRQADRAVGRDRTAGSHKGIPHRVRHQMSRLKHPHTAQKI